MVARMDDASPSTVDVSRVLLRPLANPLSLGFLGLFFATMLLAGDELGWIPASQSHLLDIGILVFTVPAQAVACVYGFLCRDLVAATGMGVEFGTWAAVGAGRLLSPPAATSPALGYILVLGAVAVLIPAVAAASSKVLAALVLCSTALRWGLTAAYQFSTTPAWKTAAGAQGVFLAVLGLYASLAFELEDQRRRTVLPTLRRGSGEVAMIGSLASQVEKVANEAGVRKQL
jgi:succinate-acetate transporter protein